MREVKDWYGTFRKADKHHRYSGRFIIIKATSLDQARKQMIDKFEDDWETIYSRADWENPEVLKRLPKGKYTELTERELARDVEREGRIRYKTFREKEA